jgi:hypothetical protein
MMKKYRANPVISSKPFIKQVRNESFTIPENASLNERELITAKIREFNLLNKRKKVTINDSYGYSFHKGKVILIGCELKSKPEPIFKPELFKQFLLKQGLNPDKIRF